MGLGVRGAIESDLPAMRDIYNEVVRMSDAIFTEAERPPAEHARWWRERIDAKLPVLVAVEESVVVGYGSFGPFRPWPGYRHTVEHSVYVRADRRRGGYGRALLAELVVRAREAGARVMVAGVDGANTASIALHEACGFQHAGRLRNVAVKRGRWLDLVFLEFDLAHT